MLGRLLLADPDPGRADLLAKHLQAAGYQVQLLPDSAAVLAGVEQEKPDGLILQAAWGPQEVLQLISQLRAGGSSVPILHLTRGDHFSERVAALQAGADDALGTPYALEELHARLMSLLRRSQMGVNDSAGSLLSYGDLLVDTDQRQVKRAGMQIRLTVKEYDLLLYLLRHQQQVLPRQRILHGVWGDTWVGDDNLLDVYVRYLRKKIERADLEPLIHTVRGVGFVLK